MPIIARRSSLLLVLLAGVIASAACGTGTTTAEGAVQAPTASVQAPTTSTTIDLAVGACSEVRTARDDWDGNRTSAEELRASLFHARDTGPGDDYFTETINEAISSVNHIDDPGTYAIEFAIPRALRNMDVLCTQRGVTP